MDIESKKNTLYKDVEKKDTDHHESMALNLVKKQLESFQSSIVNDVQNKMDNMVSEIIQEIRHYEIRNSEFKDFAKEQYNEIWSNRKIKEDKSSSKKALNLKKQTVNQEALHKFPEKVFVTRDSYLTALLEIKHMKSIYYFFIVILIFMCLNNGVHDYIFNGKINIGLGTIQTGFGRFYLALGVWCFLNLAVIGLFYAFKIWANVRFCLKINEPLQTMWNYTCVIIFISFLLLFGATACLSCAKLQLPLISSTCVLMEGCRLMMKMHGFVRTNAPKQMKGKQKIDSVDIDKQPVLPTFSSYIYFIFAPTLIYRDQYPRTNSIRWIFALQRLAELFGVMLLISHVHERYLRPTFKDFGKNEVNYATIIDGLFNAMMPGLIIFLSGFYCILHAWLNFAAEILRFGDRMFYRDWWTCGDYHIYYRHWNTVVHDYLHEYIYQDCYNYLFNKSKILSTIAVFLLSAVIHEIILSFGLKFVYPVLLFFFLGVGGVFTVVSKKVPHYLGNSIILTGACMGNGMMIGLYFMEHYARQNCPVGNDWIDFFIPVSLTCSNGVRT